MALYLVSYRSVFAVACAGVMAESLADSLASKLGPLSKRQPRDLCTGKPVPTGLSGGVTLLGTLAEALGAAVIAAIWGVGTKSFAAALVVFAAGFLGAMIDSVLGSRLQAKFRCPVCDALTERETHCGEAGALVSGFRRITNDAVNLLSNASALAFVLAIRALGAFAF